ESERRRAIEEGEAFLKHRELVADADAGESALFSVLGHKADLLFLHFRPSLGLGRLAPRVPVDRAEVVQREPPFGGLWSLDHTSGSGRAT
ncbi:hypothetical protein DJ68_02710, partial [Halorubrum sp. C3]